MSGTSTTSFTASAIVPNQDTWGHYQRFTFSNVDPLVKLQAFSEFVPTTVNASNINIESRNYKYAGFRLNHLSQVTDTNSFGSFNFQSFVSDGTGTNIFGFDATYFNIFYPANLNSNMMINVGNIGIGVSSPSYPLQFSNTTSDCKIALYSQFGNNFQVYGLGVIGGALKYSVDQSTSSHVFYCGASSTSSTELFRIAGTGILTAHNSLNMNSNQINGVAMASSPAGTDGVNVSYLNSAISSGTIVLTGNVSGSGVVGTSFSTTLNMTLDTIPIPASSVNINSKKLVNVASGSASTDGANIGNITSAISSSTITLTGNVTGTGTVGTPFATTIATVLNNIPVATGAININLQNMGNVGNIGIGLSSPVFPLEFINATADCKIALYPGVGNSFQVYGFGVTPSTLKYSVDQSTSSHVFYCGASSTTSTELFRIAGKGYATVSSGSGTLYSRVPSSSWALSSSSAGTSCVANTWIKAAGATALSGPIVQFTNTTNRITFNGTDLSTSCVGMFAATVCLAAASGTPRLGVAVYLNGVTRLGCQAYNTPSGSLLQTSLTIPNTMVTLSPGDFLEIWIISTTTVTVTVSEMCLSFIAC